MYNRTMGKIKFYGFFVFVALFISTVQPAFSDDFWVNDLRTLFISNRAVIYALNVRSFNARDNNKNDIIEIEQNEKRGTFLSAISRLDELTAMGINTVYLLPVTPTGKLKALGTAGSLYALDSFNTLNMQLDDPDNKASVFDEAALFVQEAHKRGLRVMVDMPSCGSYDLSLERPDLFVADKSGKTIVPSDWTDVRLFKVYTNDGKLNRELLDAYKSFVDLMLSLDIDGIRADVAAIKPYEFWKELIDYTRSKSPQFLFLAEASPSWTNPAQGYTPYTSLDKLLEAGFDGHYGDYGNFQNVKKSKEFSMLVQNNVLISKKYNNQKSTIASFATHDQLSPMLIGGQPYWEMLLWLNVTLPSNSYFLDGFPTGDTYIYKYENRKAPLTYTDDDIYFVHRGKFDIFNFSRKPGGPNKELYDQFVRAMKFKYWAKAILIQGDFVSLCSDNKSVFAFSRNFREDSVVVVGNLDNTNNQAATIRIPKLSPQTFISPSKIKTPPTVKRGKIEVKLQPYEIQVFVLTKEQPQNKF